MLMTAVACDTPPVATPVAPATPASTATVAAAPTLSPVPVASLPAALPTVSLPAARPTIAPPEVQVRTVFYTDTYRLLANSCSTAATYMRDHGPGGWPAETRLTFEFATPSVSLHFRPDGNGQVCAETPLDVPQTVLTFTLRLTLPDWDAWTQTGCEGAVREWQAVHDALVLHEHGHAERYQARFDEWAAKVSGRLASAQIRACGLTPEAATADAQTQVDAIVRGISEQLQSEITDDPEQTRYEDETQHGIRQGAVFHADACQCDP